jgi:hypothetical protein
VANALGWAISETKIAGIGICLSWVSSRTIRYRAGYSCSVTGLECVVAIAILSENQYIEKLNANPMPRAITAPWVPPTQAPTSTNRPPMAAIRIQVFSRLMPGVTSHPSWGSVLVFSVSPSVRYGEPRGSQASWAQAISVETFARWAMRLGTTKIPIRATIATATTLETSKEAPSGDSSVAGLKII